jgi:transposase
MSGFRLIGKRVTELQNFLKNTNDKFEHVRALAILNRHNGMTAEEAANSLHVTAVAVFNWCKRYREHGIDGIRRKKPSGRPPVVKNKAKEIIPKLLKQDPQAFGYLKGRWVVRDIADALNEEGIEIGFRYVCNILKELGLAYKRPKLTVKSDDSQYARKERQVKNYKQASAMLAKKGYW